MHTQVLKMKSMQMEQSQPIYASGNILMTKKLSSFCTILMQGKTFILMSLSSCLMFHLSMMLLVKEPRMPPKNGKEEQAKSSLFHSVAVGPQCPLQGSAET